MKGNCDQPLELISSHLCCALEELDTEGDESHGRWMAL